MKNALKILAVLFGAYLIDSGIHNVNPFKDLQNRIQSGNLTTASGRGFGDKAQYPKLVSAVTTNGAAVESEPGAAGVIARARGTINNAVDTCLATVESWFGVSGGSPTAIDQWDAIPNEYKRAGDSNPPAGAVVYWSGGSHGAGHVALSLGGRRVRSTDFTNNVYTPGHTGDNDIAAISASPSLHYVGWSQPYFNGRLVG